MKVRKFSVYVPGVFLLWSCSPISPSVHKSTISPDPVPHSADKTPNTSDILLDAAVIEPRWLNLEKNLNTALEAASSNLVLRLSSSSLERLKSEGSVEVDVPAEAKNLHSEKTRILLRVQLESEELERALSEETWKFQWIEGSSRALKIQVTPGKKEQGAPLLPEALVSIHLVFAGTLATPTTVSSQ